MGACCQSSRAAEEDDQGLHQQLTDMWVVKVSDVLQMRGVPKCHQELRQSNLLVKHTPSSLTIFVSHQWLGNDHPDCRGMQFRIFQKALKNVLDGSIKLELDATAQFFGHMKTLSAQYRKKLKDAYLWMDWFCVPQIQHETDTADRERVREEAGRCIRSIPAYVEACQIFAAVVPKLMHQDTQEFCSYFTWLNRGWCRAEMWCKLLSDRSDLPIVVINSTDQVEFAMPMQWLKSPVHEGVFSLDKDRAAVCKLIQEALDFKLARLSRQKSLDIYRYFAARYTDFLGLPKKRRSLPEFLSYFNFPSMEAAVKQKKGMGAMACAALSGDAGLLRQLAEAQAPMDTKLPEISELDVLPDWTPLHLAGVRHDEDAEAVAALLELRADPNKVNKLGHPILGTCESPRAIELLVKYRADINQMKPLTMCTPLTLACLRSPEPAVISKLLELRGDVNLRKGGIGLTPLHSLAIYSHGNPHSLKVAEMLIAARADLNCRAEAGPLFRSVELACRFIMRIRKEPPLIVRVLGEGSTTPLGYAALFGGDVLLDYLLDEGADPQVCNHRGLTPLELSRHSAVYTVLSHRTSTGSTSLSHSGSTAPSPPLSPLSPRSPTSPSPLGQLSQTAEVLDGAPFTRLSSNASSLKELSRMEDLYAVMVDSVALERPPAPETESRDGEPTMITSL